jgi:hypothetical protein
MGKNYMQYQQSKPQKCQRLVASADKNVCLGVSGIFFKIASKTKDKKAPIMGMGIK